MVREYIIFDFRDVLFPFYDRNNASEPSTRPALGRSVITPDVL